jgi:Na+/H+ antiporter NhaD/arsenite permease-like protein
MTFGQYLRRVSLGGLLSLLVLIPLLPLLMPDLWRLRRPLPPQASEKPFQRPWFALLALAVLGIMVGLFLVGEDLPIPIGPPAVAIIAASLALLVIYSVKFEPVDNVLRDIDWKTLVFLSCIFFLVEAITKTGLLQNFSLKLYEWFGTEFMLAALSLIAGIALLSSLLANIPVVAASIVMVKGYLVAVEAVPELALGAHFTDWPVATLPVFIAMMFGATLGGNATLIGAAANIVSVGICAQNGKPITFVRWLRYGLPFTACQLAVSALYVLALFHFSG